MKRFLARIGRFQAAVFSTLLYFILWVPVGLASLLFADWLRRRAPEGSNWQPRRERVNRPESLREPF